MRKPIFLTLLCLCLMGMFASASWVQAAVLYEDNFDNDGLATNTGVGSNGMIHNSINGNHLWVDDGDLTHATVGTNWLFRDIAYTADAFQSSSGFKCTVDYTMSNTTGGVGHVLLSFGLLRSDTDPATFTGRDPFQYVQTVYSLGVNVSGEVATSYRGLNFTDGSTATNLDLASFPAAVSTPVVFEIDGGGNWSYSIDGVEEAFGTIPGGFDLSQSYHFVAYGQDDQYTRSIQYVKLESLDTDKPVVDAGPDQATILPDDTVTLDAEIQDNGDPNEVLKYWWEVTSKPAGAVVSLDTGLGPFTITVKSGGDVEPNEPYAVAPQVTVDLPGVYELTLTARDQKQDTNDVVKITAYPAGYLGLTTHWKLDEGAGTAAEDAAGNFYDPNDDINGFDQLDCPGELISGNGGPDPNWIDGPNWQNSVLLVEPNDYLEAIYLDDSYMQYMAIRNLHYEGSGLEACTVTAWIKTGDSGDQIIASFDHDNYWRLEVNGTSAGAGQIGWRVMTDAGLVGISSVKRVDDNEWHHVAGVFDNGTLSIYIDGGENASTTSGSTFGSGDLRYGFIGVGSEATEYDGAKGPSWYFHGGIDDVRIYNIALTQDDILDIANIENSPPLVEAGPDMRVIFAVDGNQKTISGAVVDDIPGGPGAYTTTWSVLSGPSLNVDFLPPSSSDNPDIRFNDSSAYGLYHVQMTVQDEDPAFDPVSDDLYIMYQEKASYDLVAKYTLDESTGLLAPDSSGNGLDGTLSTLDELDPNLPEWQPAAGKIDGALWFENTDGGPNLDQFVDLSRVPGSDDLTAMFWMKADAQDHMIPLDKLDASGAGWVFRLRLNTETWFRIGNNTLQSNTNSDYATGEWVHMACTFDSGTGTAAIYVNGLSVASATGWTQSANNIHIPLRMGLPVEIAVTERFRGLLDQVRIYDRALSPLEVAKQAIADSLEIDGCQSSIPGSVIAADTSGPEGVPDCYVDLFDLAELARVWLVCTDLNDLGCDGW